MAGDELDAVVELWYVTKRAAYPYLPHCAIWVAVQNGVPLGFLAITGSNIDRL